MQTEGHESLPHPEPGPGEPEQSHKGTVMSPFKHFLSGVAGQFRGPEGPPMPPGSPPQKIYTNMGLGR